MKLVIGPFCSDSRGACQDTLIVDGLITLTDVSSGAPGAIEIVILSYTEIYSLIVDISLLACKVVCITVSGVNNTFISPPTTIVYSVKGDNPPNTIS